MSAISIDYFLNKKREAKKTLCKDLSFSRKKPLLGIFLDKEVPKEYEDKLNQIIRGAENMPVEVMILADTNLDILSNPHTIVLPYSRKNRKKLLEACDMALALEFNDVEEFLLNGIIPISCSRPEVKDYNPNKETGNSFIFHHEDPWCMFAAMVRALETFKFPYDWKQIVRTGLKIERG
jgi:hypothetical protein